MIYNPRSPCFPLSCRLRKTGGWTVALGATLYTPFCIIASHLARCGLWDVFILFIRRNRRDGTWETRVKVYSTGRQHHEEWNENNVRPVLAAPRNDR